MHIHPATPQDAEALLGIYAPYVENTAISFEETPPTVQEMARRIDENGRKYGYFVAEEDGQIIGYAYGSQYAARHAYRFTAEVSVYVADAGRGKGVGRALYQTLISHMEGLGYHTLVAIVALPNPASAAIHEAFGFERTGTLPQVGFKFDQWHDVGIWTRKGKSTAHG